MRRFVQALRRDTSGNVAISAALTLPLVIGALALGVDYGYLTLQQRQLQSSADLAAIAATGQLNDPEKAALDYFTLNNQNFAVRTDTGLLTAQGKIPFDPEHLFESYDAYAELTKGRYVADPSRPVETRFEAGATPYDAVRVTMHQKSRIFFANSFAEAPLLAATGTASADKLAAFSVGSRLASLNEGIVNALLGQLLGTTVSLKVMDYQALIDADVNLLHVLDGLAIDLGLTAGTYSEVLKTEITYGQFLQALGKATGLTPSVRAILNTLEKTVNRTQVKLRLEEILALGPLSERLVGQGDGLAVKAALMDVITAAAVAGNGGKQIGVDLNVSIPGLSKVTLTIAIGEPPVGTPPNAVGGPGTIVRTAQTRLALNVVVDGLAAIAGLKVEVPLYLEVAHAEARLADIRCYGGTHGNGSVDVEVVPGVAAIGLGNVNQAAFENFGTTPRVTKANILSTVLLSITGKADINAGNLTKKTLTFSANDITSGKVMNVSTRDTLTSLVTSLLKRLELEIKLGPLAIGTPTLIQAALADTLATLTKPLDTLVYNLLLTLGVRIGEADVRVTGLSCRNPVLVQ
ncbi:TadG family pilus assembly protein [Neorhizobium sp. CSC1952]|uniref:pilus assembly protein TadG-related protein n=1 Tax=Neorhizobium sp. CSC1952 TaxID=2978974 RepID=UPI0025A4FD64|nr:pilus assembly protein TadG-related protein [Rhizobium sp. CSC1952]WJR66717.1 TadG family pilus assembly protein [Rhizobium sp. CSC1952]